MKSGFLWVIVVVVLGFSTSWKLKTAENTPKSRVKRLMGVGIFIQNRPVRTFDTVCVLTTKKRLESYPGPSTPNVVKGIEAPIDDLVHQAIVLNRKYDKAVKRGKKPKRKRIDAIITDDARNAVAICWNAESKLNDYDHATPCRYRSVAVLLRCEPLEKYTKLYKVEVRNKLDLKFTGYGNLDALLDALSTEINRVADSTQQKPDAFITENGISGWAIIYNK